MSENQSRITFKELKESKDWKKAVIVFTDESMGNREYSVNERSYEVSSDSKYFDPTMDGKSLFGDCLDGEDMNIRLDYYLHALPEEGDKWEVEYCYIIK
ncbi:hypothetical protein BSK59_15685 [Paenibacillus odorifer]|uniref:hypothetical protein n=1 Tax=Paenibacillus odorifer TaxID=189426 RepID=UPI00096F0FE6|nr:hypothetical protein [Paenibacillus odorifer]OME54021.1 hypothetical protein BSK59_15685 [Paenibacillus odorifer]